MNLDEIFATPASNKLMHCHLDRGYLKVRGRSRRLHVFFRIVALKNLEIFTEKYLCLACEFCEIFKNTFFVEQLRWLLLVRTVAIRVVFRILSSIEDGAFCGNS